MTPKKYIFLEHTADAKFQAFGKNIEEAFKNSALALMKTITEGKKIKPQIKKKISVKGKDKENLLYNFLEEFLILLDSEGFVLSKINKIKIDKNKLDAEIFGDKASNYKFSNSVKAITYSEMSIKQKKGKFIIQVVLDV